MKILIPQKKFKAVLSLVEKISSKNISLPVLNNIVLKTENGLLKVIATNLEVGITCKIGVKIEEVGEIAVPARILVDFISNVSDESITLKTKNNILFVESEKYKTQILGSDTKDFPIIPKINSEIFCSIPSSVLKNAIYSTVDSIALSEARPELSGLYISIDKKDVVFAATDSFRLAEFKTNNEFSKENTKKSFIIPRTTVLEVLRMVSDLQEDVGIKVEDKQISFITADSELISRLIDGSYPDYTKVIPEKFISKALIDKKELEKNIRLAGLFTSSVSDIKISVNDKKMVVTAKNTDKGEIQANLGVNLKNDPFDLVLNFNYLLDGLKITNSDKVVMEFTGNGSPLLIKPSDEKQRFTYVIMPLRN